MTEPLPDTWHSRDLPVLRAAVSLFDETLRVVRGSAIVERTGLAEADVLRAAVALDGSGLLTAKNAQAAHVLVIGRPTGEARRLAGSWPTADSAADRLIAALERLTLSGTEDERGRAKKALDAMTGAGRQIAVGVATAVITGAVQ